MTKLVERVVETLPKVDAKLSYFVDVVDGTRLLLKVFDRGRGPETSLLRATALPFGTYEVVGKNVVHRYDPATTLRELTMHQQLLRSQSDAFHETAKRLAKQVGGRLEVVDDDNASIKAGMVAYRIKLKRGANVDLDKVQKQSAAEAAIVFVSDVDYETDKPAALDVLCADSVLDALNLWWGPSPLFDLLDKECGLAAIRRSRSRVLELRLERAPKNAALVARALYNEFEQAGEGTKTVAEWKQELAKRELFLWWDF